jgi:hypothetical protein
MAQEKKTVADLAGLQEGLSTLGAQASQVNMNRILGLIRRELARGVPEERVKEAMDRQLTDYDDHSRGLMLKLARGGAVPDCFPAEMVKESAQIKENTVAVTLASAPPDIALFSIVRYQQKEWLVNECAGNRLVLKAME